ncbi:molybdopterin-binding protein [Herbaspirillum sp. RTI4]|uniref:competence/damage-inducible protein A n=1 Tax=Herbaspirillum sp. RTI4 TaxID=3048640 RepID=UPI002AB3BAE1|nr:molybdopterin-binding protein [Herbaspirillum sp. RTI4]MDY7579704.1 molybdopterin-binding protein [Herbaspirillum sp. RTI4]MEA9983031.1 molybdopterin-binding protein [Herbaspirillum sp. RTI4]
MAIGLIIIGDEILSGRRTDKHFPKVLELLSARGLQLSWVEYIGDEPPRITATLRRTLQSDDIVFCTGGIGATPDDHTRQCAAAALDVPLVLHPDAKIKIQERIFDMVGAGGSAPDLAAPDNLHRLKMGEFPEGASIIPNPYNKIPGFWIENRSGHGAHYFVPGFPVMAWPMFEWVLDSRYSHLLHQNTFAEKSVLVFGMMESTLTPLMEALEANYPQIKVFSLPHVGDGATRPHIDLGVKGEPGQVMVAYDAMLAGLQSLQAKYVPGD